jgi:hypothetical protein
MLHRHGRACPHAHQDKGHAGEKSFPSPCGRGLGGGGRRPEVEPATYAATATCAGATPPPSPLPQGEGENVAPASAYPDAYGACPSQPRLRCQHKGKDVDSRPPTFAGACFAGNDEGATVAPLGALTPQRILIAGAVPVRDIQRSSEITSDHGGGRAPSTHSHCPIPHSDRPLARPIPLPPVSA